MGGYYGSPSGILKNNRNLLKKDRNKWKELMGFNEVSFEEDIKTNPELLHEIKTKLDKRNKKKKLIEAISVISFLILMAFALYYLNLIL
ncbi:hypothetical protein [Flavobacterium sp. HNIBRBA15423]|uniref:hypothetical protein n=1 Tax=Flavobacterium sp. HNIBRBA15423 TaxID=3458683 RepID=UPI004043C308